MQGQECNDPESKMEPGQISARRGMDQEEPMYGEEGQGLNRVDAMRTLESKVNQELNALYRYELPLRLRLGSSSQFLNLHCSNA